MEVMDIGKWASQRASGEERSLVARVGKALIKQGKKCLPPVRISGSVETRDGELRRSISSFVNDSLEISFASLAN